MTDSLKQRVAELSKHKIDLNMQRKLINEIDEEICLLLAERQEATLKVGIYKAQKNLGSEDSKREQQQNKLLEKLGMRYNLSDDFLIEVWNCIRTESKQMHEIVKRLL
ncbi:MAG: chorismate mutase [Alphaproteobacteria bacterium]|jgi:chorismate mutase